MSSEREYNPETPQIVTCKCGSHGKCWSMKNSKFSYIMQEGACFSESDQSTFHVDLSEFAHFQPSPWNQELLGSGKVRAQKNGTKSRGVFKCYNRRK